jgi:hypothetical protein
MRDIKYLATGLVFGVIIFCFLLVGLFLLSPSSLPTEIPLPDFLHTESPLPTSTETQNPSATDMAFPPTPTPTPTLTSTSLPLPTTIPSDSISPTPTLSPGEIMQVRGDLAIQGPLAPEEQIRLYEASLTFIASTTKESKIIGERINGKGYGSPTLICGPLSIGILQAAGLIGDVIVPYDFWLLNPGMPKDRSLLKKVFPLEKYENSRHKIRLDQFDWKNYPLQPGDFLYIYRGPGGNFDHMLVVNRVDNLGRAYAVTNYGTPEGFIINEVMLYDPSNPAAGIFQTWTEHENAMLGSTGFDGFELWRHIQSTP